MTHKTIWVTAEDIAAAHRIALRMFPGRVVADEDVLSAAAFEGMRLMRVAWGVGPEIVSEPSAAERERMGVIAREVG